MAINLSWVFPDDKPNARTATDVELLEIPNVIGPLPNVLDYEADPEGVNMLIAGASGRYVLTLVPRSGRANEYDAILGRSDRPVIEYNGGCHTILADASMIAALRRGIDTPSEP